MQCASFADAYGAAVSGDVVGVTGTLGPQLFAGGYGSSQGSDSKALTFAGAPGNIVRRIHSGSPNLTYDGINVDAGGAQLSGSDGAVFENGGGDNLVFRNGSIGGVVDQKGALVDGNNMVFDNVRFHDVVIRTSGVHSECMFAEVPEGMVVRNSTFTNCAVMDIFFVWPDWWSPLPPPYGNVTLDRNNFGDPDGSCCGIYIGGTGPGPAGTHDTNMRGWKIRNNFFGDSQSVGAELNSVICGNTGSVPEGWKQSC